MRFHFGVSFRLKTLKKFLFPILIGILAYFGINFLGLGIINVNALENYDTSFTLYYRDELSYLLDTKVDNSNTYRDYFDNLNTISSDYYNIIVMFSTSSSYGKLSITGHRIYFIPKSTSSVSSSLFSDSSSFYIRLGGNSYNYVNQYLNTTNVGTDIFTSQMYLDIVNCLQNNNCTSSYISTNGSMTYNIALAFPINNVIIDNNNSYEVFSPSYTTGNSLQPKIIYSSQVPIYISNDYNISNSNTFYKKLIFYDKELNIGDYFPTYKDYLDNLPIDDGNDDDITNHKALFNKIYWFDDNTTELGVLSSIYILLFLYCITIVFFKIATLLKNKRW